VRGRDPDQFRCMTRGEGEKGRAGGGGVVLGVGVGPGGGVPLVALRDTGGVRPSAGPLQRPPPPRVNKPLTPYSKETDAVM